MCTKCWVHMKNITYTKKWIKNQIYCKQIGRYSSAPLYNVASFSYNLKCFETHTKSVHLDIYQNDYNRHNNKKVSSFQVVESKPHLNVIHT